MIRGIRRQSTFASLRAQGRRVRRRGLAVVYLPFPSPDTEVAFAISRRTANAVRRNRCRRRVRAALVDLHREARLPSGAYLITVSGGAVESPQSDLRSTLESMLAQLASGEQ